MPLLTTPSHLLARTTIMLACASVVACGGGGDAAPETATSSATSIATAPEGQTAKVPTADQTNNAEGTATLASAMAQSASDAVWSADTSTQANAVAKSAIASIADAGSLAPSPPHMTIQAVAAGTSAIGNTYYVDSISGNDANNGTSPTASTSGIGPWRTLAKLAAAALKPGDTVRLNCGSVWNDTLRVGASGIAGSPITVASYPAGCANAPVIDGSTTLPTAAWTLHQGNIYKAPLASAPLQLFSSTGYMTPAHHPNAGFDPTAPTSVYLRNASNSDGVLVSGRTVSTYLTTGPDLVLPVGATVTPGTKVRVRTLSWLMDERTVSAVNGTRLTLDSPTTYRLDSGWGYFLMGQLWMLDAPGEWQYDSNAKQLYAWMPDSRAPASAVMATQLATGIDLASRSYVTVENITVRRASVGMDLRKSTGITVRNSRIEDTVEHGIYATVSSGAVVSGNVLIRTGTDAVSGQEDTTGAAVGMQVLNNTLSDIGVTMSGETMLSLPARSRAAIRTGTGALVEGNTLTNTGYIGIWVGAGSTVRSNTVTGACTVLDDCGGIYTSGASNNSVITGNIVRHSRLPTAGKPSAFARSQSQGIYLDETASGVTVADNTVVDTDNGIHLHVAPNNTLRNNKLYGNRVSQIWLQETRNALNPLGDLYGNTVTGNQVVPTSATAKGLYLDSLVSDTTRFATFDLNRYLDTIYPVTTVERALSQVRDYTFPQWRAAMAAGVPRNLDANGFSTSQTRFASVLMNGSSIVPNGSLGTNSTGWTTWNATAPLGYLVREACAPGWCARYVTGGSAGILSSPNFSVVGATWYRISVDVATGADNQSVDMVVRRGGGGINTYETLSDRSLKLTAGTGWKRYSLLFKATKTVNANDPLTKDLGARVDFQNIAPGQKVSVSNLEIVPIVPAEALTRVDLLLNAAATPTQVSCPAAASQPALCSIYVRLTDSQPVAWPAYLAPRSSEIVYTRDVRLIDTDGDGVPDQQDSCAGTPTGAGVNSRGCALGQ